MQNRRNQDAEQGKSLGRDTHIRVCLYMRRLYWKAHKITESVFHLWGVGQGIGVARTVTFHWIKLVLFELFTLCRFYFFNEAFLMGLIRFTGLTQGLNKLIHVKYVSQNKHSVPHHHIYWGCGSFNWPPTISIPLPWSCFGQEGASVPSQALLRFCLLQKNIPEGVAGPTMVREIWDGFVLNPQLFVFLRF